MYRVSLNVFRRRLLIPILLAGLLAAASDGIADETATQSPDVLVLGDSQLTFGAGPAFVDFLAGLGSACGLEPGLTTGVIGVRSSTPRAWAATDRKGKAALCNVDPKWQVNAGTYGVLNATSNPYVQIGKGERYQFCKSGISPLQAMFDDGAYDPRLLILFFLGNSAERWADDPDTALADLRAMSRALPPGLPCVFVTTAPTYSPKVGALRQRAQDALARAFASGASHCSFVPGFVPDTIAANQGNPRHFRRKASGRVKDPYHPTEAAARAFLKLRRGALCQAIKRQLMSQ